MKANKRATPTTREAGADERSLGHAGMGSARVRFAVAGLTLALLFAFGAQTLARSDGFAAPFAGSALAAALLVVIGFALGRRFDTLEQRSLEDPVTRVGNRRHWEARLSAELARAARSRMPMSLLVLDVDHLKTLNDAQGHACGDRALTIVGDVLRATCRSRDTAARFGGDEFALLLPRTRAAEARVVAERIRAELARRRSSLAAPLDTQLTVSIGVADLGSALEPTARGVFEAADAALYAAKKGGRDRVVVQPRPRVGSVIELDTARTRRANA